MSEFSNYLEAKLDELVTANRIPPGECLRRLWTREHKTPDRDDRYFLSRSRALKELRWMT